MPNLVKAVPDVKNGDFCLCGISSGRRKAKFILLVILYVVCLVLINKVLDDRLKEFDDINTET